MRKFLSLTALIGTLALSAFALEGPPPAPERPRNGAEPAAAAAAVPPATRPAERLEIRGPVLTGDDGKVVEGVRLARADVHVVVNGSLAQTTMTLTFGNAMGRVLGGELTFPLPDGATVSGYGLDVNGVMVDGVAIEKQRARIIYETEMRKSVDPGLVEHVVGNAFRTRLYPIPPNGTRTIKVQYVSEAVKGADGPAVVLPLGWQGQPPEAGTVRVEARRVEAAPAIKSGDFTRALEKNEAGFAGEVRLFELKSGDLTIALPQLPDRSVAVEKRMKIARTVDELDEARKGDAAKRFDRFEHFFVISDTPKAEARAAAAPPAALNRRVAVIWDASLSRADADKTREIALLERVLTQMNHPAADLIVLRDKTEVKSVGAIGADGTKAIIAAIRELTYDGATNLGGLKLPASIHGYGIPSSQPAAPYTAMLLFTDGLGNLGEPMPAAAEAPVYAISNSTSANPAILRALSQKSGGAYFNLKSASDEQVLAGVTDRPFAFLGAEFDKAEIAEIHPAPGQVIQGRFTLSGRLLVPEAKVTLKYGHGAEVLHREVFTVKAADATEDGLLPRFWAQQKAAELSLLPEANADELTKLGKEFNLVTPATSLLVLETVDQYVQHRVVPPKNRKEIYEQFIARIEQNRATEEKSREEKLTQVAAMWDARVKWWETKFEYPANLRVQPESPKTASVALATDGSLPAPARVASPTPAPMPPSASAPRGEPAPAEPAAPGHPDAPRPAPGLLNDTAPAQEARDVDGLARGSGPAGGSGALFGSARGGQGGRNGERLAKGAGGENDEYAARISIKAWDPNTPYIAAMKAVAADKAYGVYLEQRNGYVASPAFYLDCGDYLLRNGQRELGVRVLTNVAELQLGDARLLRVAAHRLNQIGERDLAIDLFEKVQKLRPEEPQSFRDLALALADRAHEKATMMVAGWGVQPTGQIASDYARSLELLNKVITGNWDRFAEIEVIALMEANRIMAQISRVPDLGGVPNPIDARLRKAMDLDVRIIMTWDADMTDIDLWVTEPSGEKCYYGHNRTVIGGLVSKDFTQGYGPEEYCLRKLMPGEYKIQANYYGSRQQELTGPCTVQATVITNFGRPDEQRQSLTLRLTNAKEIVDIGTVTLGAGAKPAVAPATKPAELNK